MSDSRSMLTQAAQYITKNSLASGKTTERPKVHTQIPMKSTITIFNIHFSNHLQRNLICLPWHLIVICWHAAQPLILTHLYVVLIKHEGLACLLQKMHAKVRYAINIITCYSVRRPLYSWCKVKIKQAHQERKSKRQKKNDMDWILPSAPRSSNVTLWGIIVIKTQQPLLQKDMTLWGNCIFSQPPQHWAFG